MNEKAILGIISSILKKAAHQEISLNVVLESFKKNEAIWAVWQDNKRHMITFFSLEWKRARKDQAA